MPCLLRPRKIRPSLDMYSLASLEKWVVLNARSFQFTPEEGDARPLVAPSGNADGKYSSCVGVFVPGVNVLSSCKGGSHAVATVHSSTAYHSPRATPNFFGASECVYVVLRAVSPCPFASILLAPLELATTENPTVLPANTVNLLIFNNATVFSLLYLFF
ncbi:hypothetical protein B0H14DRAFT_3436477 [Mycena olivaceomarginata]|nr:hypothetical protein B0H14DRAFT_3436477 [Mycena olivaceomarginata]